MTYTGYLAPHIALVIEGHRQGLPPAAIAERLYQAGARAQSSERHIVLTPERHVRNLQGMVIYVLMRLGLRVRIPRAARRLTARPNADRVWEV